MTQQPGGWPQQPPQQYQPPQQPHPQQQAAWGQQPPAQQAPWGQQPQQGYAAPAPDDGSDPFAAAAKAPALSFKDAPIGSMVTLVVTDKPKTLQQRDFETNALDWWPPEAPGLPAKPKMAAVVNGTLNGEARSVWAPIQSKEGSMCRAIADAQAEAGKKIEPGDQLSIALVGMEPPPPDKPRNSPRKLYKARLVAGAPGSAGDVFAQQAPPQQAPAPQQAPPPQWAQQPPQAPPQNQAPNPQQAWPQAPQQGAPPQSPQGDPWATGQDLPAQAIARVQEAQQQAQQAPPANPWANEPLPF